MAAGGILTPAFSTPHVTVYCGHVLDVLADLPDESADCCVTSPPYWGQVCLECGKARERISGRGEKRDVDPSELDRFGTGEAGTHRKIGGEYQKWLDENPVRTTGFTDCGHDTYVTGVVLDPFAGSGTTLAVARDLGRRSVGIELNPEYVRLIEKRCGQLALELGA